MYWARAGPISGISCNSLKLAVLMFILVDCDKEGIGVEVGGGIGVRDGVGEGVNI